MHIFIVEAFAATASFRIPENHTFQKTLPLPPVTTLTGLMGAALGFDFEKVMNFKRDNQVKLGVYGTSLGEMRDLWKYNKIKTSEWCKDILIREFLTDFSMLLAIGCKNENVLKTIRNAFENPKFALTAGNSDDLLKIRKISQISYVKEEHENLFENTMLLGNHLADYESQIDLENTPITFQISAPQVYKLPTDFDFKGKERRVKSKEFFTIIGSPVKIKNSIPAYRIDGKVFSLS
jgi:CRISPR-associated protein Cas5t